jgi:prophage DNA circulation protein
LLTESSLLSKPALLAEATLLSESALLAESTLLAKAPGRAPKTAVESSQAACRSAGQSAKSTQAAKATESSKATQATCAAKLAKRSLVLLNHQSTSDNQQTNTACDRFSHGPISLGAVCQKAGFLNVQNDGFPFQPRYCRRVSASKHA